jgi:hypothetical protein
VVTSWVRGGTSCFYSPPQEALGRAAEAPTPRRAKRSHQPSRVYLSTLRQADRPLGALLFGVKQQSKGCKVAKDLAEETVILAKAQNTEETR